MVASKLFLGLVVVVAAFVPLPIVAGADTCQCQVSLNQTVSSTSQTSILIHGPTINNNGGTGCAVSCTTNATFLGSLSGTALPGISITSVSLAGLNATTYININGGSKNINISTNDRFEIDITDSNTVSFNFHFTSNANVFLFLSPIEQVQQATTTQAPPSTPAYNGPYPANPSSIRLDLVIGLDAALANKDALDAAKNTIKEIVHTFDYSQDSARLSLFTFNPKLGNINIGFGNFLPWSLDATTFDSALNFISYITGSNSEYFAQLKNIFFQQLTNSTAFRENTERVLLIFTANDANVDDVNAAAVLPDIKSSKVKVIIANVNNTIAFSQKTFPILYNFFNPTNLLVSYDFVNDGTNNTEQLLQKTIFNGNAIGHLVNQDPTLDDLPKGVSDSVPLSNFTQYDILTNYKRDYILPSGYTSIQIAFKSFETNYNTDFITVSVDNVPVTRLTGQGSGTYLCVKPANNASVTFTSSVGKVYSGYESKTKAFDTVDNCKGTVPSFGFSKQIMKYIKL